jgi:hypothetical protein
MKVNSSDFFDFQNPLFEEGTDLGKIPLFWNSFLVNRMGNPTSNST